MAQDGLIEAWLRYDGAHPEFWPEFMRFAREAAAAGVARTSGWLIVNRMRWESRVVRRRGDDEAFAIPNDFVALYARRFRIEHPRHQSLFHVKRMRRATEEEVAAAVEIMRAAAVEGR